MESLRTRQKIARRQQILTSAREQFLEHGYGKANMESIAADAEVGVATIYTYFGCKEGILAELFRSDIDAALAKAEHSMAILPDSPKELILALIAAYDSASDELTLDYMRDFIFQSSHQGPVRDAITWCRDMQSEQLSRAFRRGQELGVIAPSLDVEVAAMIVLNIFYNHLEWIATGLVEAKDRRKLLPNKIDVLLQDWLN